MHHGIEVHPHGVGCSIRISLHEGIENGLVFLQGDFLTPHLGYCAREVYSQFYRESIENVLAFLDGKPTRVLNPEAVSKSR